MIPDPPEWLARVTVAELVVFLSFLVGVMVLLVRLSRAVWSGWSRIVETLEDLQGHPERLGPTGQVVEEARPSVRELLTAHNRRLDEVERGLARVAKEVLPNSGSSLRDAVDRVERRLDEATVRLDDAADERAEIRTTIAEIAPAD